MPGDTVGYMRNGGAVVEFRRPKILDGPDLTPDFDGMVYVSVCVNYPISRTKRKQN
jgi:hypothetical protein